MTYAKRALAALTAFIMLLLPALAEESDGAAEAIPASDIADDGLIRVYLASLGEPQALLITVAGEYAVDASDALRFDRGAELALAAEDGSIYMSVGGATLNMGSGFTLTRCAADEGAENGLYIYESERNALYEGDLRITCQGDCLSAVITLGMEDYLCGVVAYEMSDSFPLEALKAQAVAARTYAMSKKVARAASDYDVTDTTSDQVFKGFIGDYTNVIRAVRETEGVVGTYNGNYAVCYYTASNGGQIATPNQIWGGEGDYGYIEQKDDPYDVENPSSLISSISVPAEYSADSAVWQLLVSRLDVPGHVKYRADRIVDVTLAEPAFEGSRMCRQMQFTLEVSARDLGLCEAEPKEGEAPGWSAGYVRMGGKWYTWGLKDWETLDETVCVTLSVYDDVKNTLGLSLNSRNYEVPSVTYADGEYLIEMRRFGHGVGMSQRGAQTMAGEYGFSYVEILKFYYPGMQLERIAWLDKPLIEMDQLPQALITERLLIPPMEGNLGELAPGEYFARVTLDNARSRLNVRARPSTDAGIVAKLDTGYRLVVMEVTEDGWAHVRAARFTGYVKLEYIEAE